jgi:ABC-type branched-subunit amino acid transport system substrate-binding protein
MIREKGHKKIAVLRVNNRYGRVGIGEFRDSARRLGYPLVLEVRYTPGDTTFQAQINRIIQSDPDAVMIWPNDEETGANIIAEMNEMGLDVPIYGCDRLASQKFIDHAGELAEGVITTYPYNPKNTDPLLLEFNKKYIERFGEEPDSFAAHAYDGMNILISAIRKAGLNRVLIRDILMDLETFQGYKGVTGEVILDATWNDIGPIWMVEINNGELVFTPAPQINVQEP